MQDGHTVVGESQISNAGGQIKKLHTEPIARAIPEVLHAITNADLIILGPGSLYTSIIPNLLVQGIPEAITKAEARKLYVCNVMTQMGETINYSVADHLEALLRHANVSGQSANRLVQSVLINDQLPTVSADSLIGAVSFDSDRVNALGITVLRKPLLDESVSGHHDSEKLANEIMMWFLNDKSKPEKSQPSKNVGVDKRVASFFSTIF